MVSVPVIRRNLGVRVMPLPMSPSIARCLLVSRDPVAIKQISSAMDPLAITTEVCTDSTSARQMLNTRKFDAVAVDFDLGEQAPSLLAEMRVCPSNRTAPAIAITRSPSELALAYCAGTNFVLQKPLTAQVLNHMLNVGYGLVVRERRRYFRCRIKTPVLIRRVDMRETRCHAVNVSEGGMEIVSAPPKLTPEMKVRVEFALPCPLVRIKTICEVRWRDRRGHAGLQFLFMPLEQRCDLQEWLAGRLEESLPESIVERFRDVKQRFRFQEELDGTDSGPKA
ncbi:MAG TPA: PilZ domain-containing protein [Terriglobales bacterium]|nr:PilZ domain-containing protein [Terriglobales bacterium]